jgi:hypothetical protein
VIERLHQILLAYPTGGLCDRSLFLLSLRHVSPPESPSTITAASPIIRNPTVKMHPTDEIFSFISSSVSLEGKKKGGGGELKIQNVAVAAPAVSLGKAT